MRARGRAVTLVVTALTVVALLAVAFGDGPRRPARAPSPEVALALATPTSASEFAAAQYAAKTGATMAEARAFLAAQSGFGAAVDALRSDYADVLSAAYWDRDADHGTVVLVSSGPADRTSAAAALALAAGAAVRYDGQVPASTRSAQAVAPSAYLLERRPDLRNLSVHPSHDYGGLVVETDADLSAEVAAWSGLDRANADTTIEIVRR
jgi:hypothetical protein